MSQQIAAMEHMTIAKVVAAYTNSHGDIKQMISRTRYTHMKLLYSVCAAQG